jgi:Arc/MetJ family transcription regulator
MRTNIMIDDDLMADVLKLTGIKSKREAVEQGLRTLLALKQQEKIKHKKVRCVGRRSGADEK